VEWIKTYSSEEFEELAKTLEDLLDEYATKESTSYEDLLPIYTRAMELEFAFFDAQPDLPANLFAGIKPDILAVDFDQTLTEHDTTETIVQTGWQSLQDEQTLEARKQTLNHVSESFYDQYKKTIDRLLKENKPTTDSYDPQALRNFFDGLAAFDKKALKPVEDAGLLTGISQQALVETGRRVCLQRHAMQTLLRSVKAGYHLHIVSVNWSKDLIRSALKKSQEEEEEKARSTHGERGEGEGLKYELHSPNLLFEDGVSIGKLSGPPSTAIDKLDIFEKILAETPRNRSVYVGDSVTDVLALLRADIGIVVGSSSSLLNVLSTFNVRLVPLISIIRDKSQEKEGEKFLFAADSWADIQVALHGASGYE